MTNPRIVWQWPRKQTTIGKYFLTFLMAGERPDYSSPVLSGRDDEDAEDNHEGDYSTRMEELFGDEGEVEANSSDDDEFVYDGVDAERVSGANYQQQLRDVLGSDDASDNLDEEEVEKSLFRDDPSVKSDEVDSVALVRLSFTLCLVAKQQQHRRQVASGQASPVLPSPSLPTLAAMSPLTDPNLPSVHLHTTVSAPQAFIHPTVSRLRSSLLQSPAHLANSSLPHDSLTPTGVRSPLSQASNISRVSTPLHQDGMLDRGQTANKEVFKWTSLQNVSSQLFRNRPSKAAVLLGASNLGSPTVLAANGLICVGTDAARIFVFDFKQELLCICGSDPSGGYFITLCRHMFTYTMKASTAGAISALALSQDHTYVASGHVSGHVLLYNLKNPQVPARIVTPASPQLVLSGRQEGHLTGSRIVNVCFVAGRHTAIVTADEHGLAFYHNLSKVLFVEASDTIRILGNYPEEERIQGNGPKFNSFRRRRSRNTMLAQATLPLGSVSHPTDAYQLVAMLTPSKLVIVGLRPTPKTWLKRLREDSPDATPSDRRRGALAWFPSTKLEPDTKGGVGETIAPTIAYSWGKIIHLIRVSETKVKQFVPNSRTGKMRADEVGTLVFEDCGRWTMDDIVLTLHWLNVNVSCLHVPRKSS